MKKVQNETWGNVEFKYGRSDFSQTRQQNQSQLKLSEKLLRISIWCFSAWMFLAVFGSSFVDLAILALVGFCFFKFVKAMKGDISNKKKKYTDPRFQFLSLIDESQYVTCLFNESKDGFELLVDDNGMEMRLSADDIAEWLHIRTENVYVDKSIKTAAERTHKLVVDMSKRNQLKFSAVERGLMFS